MFDLSKEFNDFYTNFVVLPNKEQNQLRKKKNLNIKRLKSGLKEYNAQHNTNYKICETRVQGSMAMHTVVQNDSNDYDIDVAIVFEKDNLGETTGPRAARNIIVEALKKKCIQFNTSPECKTNCVRISYADGYHIDFAIYRRYKTPNSNTYIYEHAGNSWSPRNPAAINDWFANKITDKGQCLRQIVRLSKMFCKSRDSWVNMPGGLLQTVVCEEVLENGYTRLDEIMYHTMKEVKKRLDSDIEVYNPTDSSLPLLFTEPHRNKMRNWCSRLGSKLDELDILFDSDCTYKDALDAWHRFFDHDFWYQQSLVEYASFNEVSSTEQFIENEVININEQYYVNVNCQVSANGFLKQSIQSFLEQYPKFSGWLPHGFSIDFTVTDTNVPEPYEIWWKVRNIGEEAKKRQMIRGQIEKKVGRYKKEKSDFYGPHYVECYIIKNNECVAIDHVEVPIGH